MHLLALRRGLCRPRCPLPPTSMTCLFETWMPLHGRTLVCWWLRASLLHGELPFSENLSWNPLSAFSNVCLPYLPVSLFLTFLLVPEVDPKST